MIMLSNFLMIDYNGGPFEWHPCEDHALKSVKVAQLYSYNVLLQQHVEMVTKGCLFANWLLGSLGRK